MAEILPSNLDQHSVSAPEKQVPNKGEKLQESLAGRIEKAVEQGEHKAMETAKKQTGGTIQRTKGKGKGRSTTQDDRKHHKVPTTEEELKSELRPKLRSIMQELDTEISTLKNQKKPNANHLARLIERKREFANMLLDLAHMAIDRLKAMYKRLFPDAIE